MKKQAYLIFDVGTGNSRAAVVSAEGKLLAAARENTSVYADADIRNSVYFRPEEWRSAVFRLAEQACREAPDAEICAVSATSQREGIVLLDRDGEAIAGYTNADRRGEPWMDEPDWARVFALTNLSPSPVFSAVKLLGQRHLDPEVLRRTRFVTSISDWIGRLFTGRCVWERAQAIQSALYDPRTGAWSDELCGSFGLDPAILPPLADAGTVLGPVLPQLCGKLGLAADTPFIVGTADTQAAVTGTGAGIGETVIVSGTTTPCLHVLPEFRSFPLAWVSPAAQRGSFLLEINTTTSGINLQRWKDSMLPDISYQALDEDAVRRGLPEQGLPPCYAMFLRGMHLDEDNLTGGFIMASPISPALRREDFFQALSLGIGMGIARCLERMESLVPSAHDYVIGCGGGFASPVIGQTVADLSGKTVRVYDNYRESSVSGCCELCARALKLPLPARSLLKEIVPRESEELRRYYQKWLETREALKPLKL